MLNFVDVECSLVDIKTTQFKENKTTRNKSSSTGIEIFTNNTGCQTTFDVSVSTQTNIFGTNDEIITFNSLSSKELQSLTSFLNKMEPVIMDEFKKNSETNNILSEYTVEWEDAPNSVCLEAKMCFRNNNTIEESDNNMSYAGLCMDINKNSSRIAIGFGLKEQHISWCLHSTHIVIWNINNTNTNKEYEHCIEISSCCSAIKYHPIYDNILCFGLFNGLISVYQFDNNGDSLSNKEICTSSISDCYHKETITNLHWIKNNYNNNLYNLISISID
eukprot:73429_1